MATICIPSFLSLLIIFTNFIPHLANNTTLPVIFIFGDSTADVGTNNYLNSSNATANFPHNGIDFPNSRPTGRFSNGFNSVDFLGKSTRSQSRGVNFASGGSGILRETGSNLITQFTSVRDNFTAMIGPAATEALLSKSLFFISVGSNDIFDYFSSKCKTPEEKFISNMISVYCKHIKNLYRLGARKFGIINVPAVGCCPSQRLVQKQINGTNGCYEAMNDFALAFDLALDSLLRNISLKLPGIKYSLGNAHRMTLDVITNSEFFGKKLNVLLLFSCFSNVDSACCGTGTLNAQGRCNSTAYLCPNRPDYLFWDLFHPTQKASNLSAQTLYNGPQYYVSPTNFAQLAKNN
ncbi:hypothetical protein DH2020_023677 [Rehmannia glutinosa]|uniref:GDSL esterase/lipase n=1 Tax=Rehmannia glutinosa TaxID=99300 RepID=A0ABR0WB68_REHGL